MGVQDYGCVQRLLRHCAKGRAGVLDGHCPSSRCTESLLRLVGVQGCREGCSMKCEVSFVYFLPKTGVRTVRCLCLCIQKLLEASLGCFNLSRFLQWRKHIPWQQLSAWEKKK